MQPQIAVNCIVPASAVLTIVANSGHWCLWSQSDLQTTHSEQPGNGEYVVVLARKKIRRCHYLQ